MRTNRGISKAYAIEDRSQFLDETLACYKQMLVKELTAEKNRFLSEEANMRKHCCIESSRKEMAFRDWLESELYERAVLAPSPAFEICSVNGDKRMPEVVLSSPDSMRTHYYTRPCSSCSSLLGSGEDCRYGLLESDDSYESKISSNCGNCDCYLVPVEAGCDVKSRTGSWSDSGYCCDKSDSDNSRFSSLSFSECQEYVEQDLCAKQLGQRNVRSSNRTFGDDDALVETTADLDHYCGFITRLKTLGEVGSMGDRPIEQVFDEDSYTAEEKEILRELMRNPENFHETTKELSDIARDVSSKGWRKKQSKAMSFIGQFVRKVFGNARRCASDKNKLKPASTEFGCDNEDSRKSREQRKFSIKSCSSPFRRRSSSAKANKTPNISVCKGDKKTIQRTNSYSSLFGRNGGIFSHVERNENCMMVRRSHSFDTLPNTHLTDSRKVIDTCLETFTTDCDGIYWNYDGDEERCYEYFDAHYGELLAPLAINVREERSALTRKIKKLHYDVISNE